MSGLLFNGKNTKLLSTFGNVSFERNISSESHLNKFYTKKKKTYALVQWNGFYSSYRAEWQIPKLLVIAHEKMSIARNYYYYKVFTV